MPFLIFFFVLIFKTNFFRQSVLYFVKLCYTHFTILFSPSPLLPRSSFDILYYIHFAAYFRCTMASDPTICNIYYYTTIITTVPCNIYFYIAISANAYCYRLYIYIFFVTFYAYANLINPLLEIVYNFVLWVGQQYNLVMLRLILRDFNHLSCGSQQ